VHIETSSETFDLSVEYTPWCKCPGFCLLELSNAEEVLGFIVVSGFRGAI
jgi:hypothetical protein